MIICEETDLGSRRLESREVNPSGDYLHNKFFPSKVMNIARGFYLRDIRLTYSVSVSEDTSGVSVASRIDRSYKTSSEDFA